VIHKATEADILEIVGRGYLFHQSDDAASCVPYDPESVVDFTMNCIDNGVFLLSDDGMIAGTVVPMFYNASFYVMVEQVWFTPTGDKGLLARFEEEAKALGARALYLSHFHHKRLNVMQRFLRARGYTPHEHLYMKAFSDSTNNRSGN